MVTSCYVKKFSVALCIACLLFSCAKDSDLLDEYDAIENVDIDEGRNFVKDDVFTLNGNNSIVLDVLSNDNFPNLEKVRITNISNPSLGVVEILEDNTIVYTPVVRTKDSGESNNDSSTNNEEGSSTDSSSTDTTSNTTDTNSEESSSEESTSDDTATDGSTDTNTNNTDGSESTESQEEGSADQSNTGGGETADATGGGEESTEDESNESSEGAADTSATSDTFNYTAETVNEDGTTTTEQGSVTVEHGDNTAEEGSGTEDNGEEGNSEGTEETDGGNTETPPIADNARYVTNTGSASNDGLTEGTAWSIEHAFRVAEPGQTVYIKAGRYGRKELILYQGGSPGKPIRFIGYRNTPEDIQTTSKSTFTYGDEVDEYKMPLFQGNAPSGKAEGRAMRIDMDYVEISNIQFTRYDTAILNQGSHCVYTNIITSYLGDFSSSASYSGVGLRIKGSYNTVRSSFMLNPGAEGVTMSNCSNCRVENVEVASDDNANPTDYYILLTGGTSNTEVVNSLVRRKTGLSHPGHGLVMKAGARNNTIRNSTAINTVIELQFSDVHDNTVKDCSVTGTYSSTREVGAGVVLANGAHHNVLQNISVNDSYGAVHFKDWNDGTGLPNDANDAGNNNEFINIRATNGEYGIVFDEFAKLEGRAWDNTFSSCTFQNLTFLFRVNRPNSGTRVIGCTVENVPRFSATSSGYGYSLNANTVFENNTWTNVGFNTPD